MTALTSNLYKELSKERKFQIEVHENNNYMGLIEINGRKRFGLKQARTMMNSYSVLNNGLDYKLIEL
jgi:hypothetical protein